jgi:hypothetical protein
MTPEELKGRTKAFGLSVIKLVCRKDQLSFRPKSSLLSSLPLRLSTQVEAAGGRKTRGRSGEIWVSSTVACRFLDSPLARSK